MKTIAKTIRFAPKLIQIFVFMILVDLKASINMLCNRGIPPDGWWLFKSGSVKKFTSSFYRGQEQDLVCTNSRFKWFSYCESIPYINTFHFLYNVEKQNIYI